MAGSRLLKTLGGTLALSTVLLSGTALAADLPATPVVSAPMVVTPIPEGPGFYATFSALAMTRSTPAPQPIITIIPSVSGRLVETVTTDGIDASDFDFGWSLGFAARAGVTGDRFGVEVGGFWIRPMESAVYFENEFFDTLRFHYLQPVDFEFQFENGLVDVNGFYVTRLHGLDANVTARLGDNLMVYGGVAYFSLAETLSVLATSAVDYTTIVGPIVSVANRMIGPQIGARFTVEAGERVTIAADLRAAYLFNRVTTGLDYYDGGTLTAYTGGPYNVRSTMLGAGISASFDLSETVALTVGYQAMWFRNVGLAGGMFAVNVAPPETGAVQPAFGNLLVHGASAGISIRF